MHLLTGGQAAHLGLTDRGQVKAGLKADLNVIDLGALRLHRPAMVRDLPGGSQRLLQGFEGFFCGVAHGFHSSRQGKAWSACR